MQIATWILIAITTCQFTLAHPALYSTKLSDTFQLITMKQDQIEYATAFGVVNTAQNPKLPWMTCFIDNEKLTPLRRPDHELIEQLKQHMSPMSSTNEIFYHIYRMPFLNQKRSYTLRLGASASLTAKEDAVMFSIPLHVVQLQISSLFSVQYPIAHIVKDSVLMLEGRNLEWDDEV